MNKQELIKKLEELLTTPSELEGLDFDDGYDFGIESAITLAKDLEDPVRPPEPKPLEIEKPVVPQFVADWYEENKDDFEYNLYQFCIDYYNDDLDMKMMSWFHDEHNKQIQTLVNMHQFGYEVQKEKLYTVEIPNPNYGERPILYKNKDGKVSIIFPSVPCWREVKNAQLTEEEIKQDFEWAWQFAKEVNNNE